MSFFSTKHFYESFIQDITHIFNEFGFKFQKSKHGFKKEVKPITFLFEVRKLDGGLNVELSIEITHRILNDILSIVLGSDQAPYPTIFWGPATLVSFEESRFFITEKDEIDSGKRNVEKLFHKYALPFFEKYSTIKGLEELINNENEYPFFVAKHGVVKKINISHSTDRKATVYNGLILAKLQNRKDFDYIKERNMSQLNQFEVEDRDLCLSRFEKVDWDKYRKLLGLEN